ADATAVGKALTDLFVNKCSKPVPLTPESPAEFQGSCLANGCPVIDAAQCPPGFTAEGVQPGQGQQGVIQGGAQGGMYGQPGVYGGKGQHKKVFKCVLRQGHSYGSSYGGSKPYQHSSNSLPQGQPSYGGQAQPKPAYGEQSQPKPAYGGSSHSKPY
ncbi:hypothetical protein BC833DRAFT_314677, partial [Globomyces pollinis-pini]